MCWNNTKYGKIMLKNAILVIEKPMKKSIRVIKKYIKGVWYRGHAKEEKLFEYIKIYSKICNSNFFL